MSEIIQITDTARLVVEQDYSPTCPRGDWHMLTGFVKLGDEGDSRRSNVPAVHDDPIGIEAAYDRFDEARYRRGTYNEYDLTARWARIFHGLHIEHDSDHGGYWFVAGADYSTYGTQIDTANRALFSDNWPDLKPGSSEHLAKQAEVIGGERETYRQWADGEVYTVKLQRATAMAPVTYNERAGVWDLRTPLTDADIDIEWEDEDSIGDLYLDDDYTAQAVAKEYFDLSQTEIENLTEHTIEIR